MGLSLQILFCSTTEDKKTEPTKLVYTYTEPVINDLAPNLKNNIENPTLIYKNTTPIIYSYTQPINNKN